MKKTIATAISLATLFLSTATPTFAATTIQISGNGAGSSNSITLNKTGSNSVNQTNNANISNNVSGNTNTGNNHANGNTGGSSSIKTGNSSSKTTITTHANVNMSKVGCCNGSNCP
jgi:hypothetical protein